ncbi:MAG: IS30 family transposase [Francisella sp.]|jgi:IS30 family transposase
MKNYKQLSFEDLVKIETLMEEDFADLPARLCINMTYDNGKEFSKHENIEKVTGMTVYFARAYASWQRGTNKNTNGLLRQFIPKGTDFDTVSDDDLAKYVDLINNRPRKRLNWLSPNQVFDRELNSVALGTGIQVPRFQTEVQQF